MEFKRTKSLNFMDFAGDVSGCFRILLHQFLSNWTIPLLTNCFTIRPSNFRGFPFATFNYRRVHTHTHTYIYIYGDRPKGSCKEF